MWPLCEGRWAVPPPGAIIQLCLCDGWAVWGMAAKLISGSQLCSLMREHIPRLRPFGCVLEAGALAGTSPWGKTQSLQCAGSWLAVRAPSAFSRVRLDPDQFYALFLQSHVKLSWLGRFPRDTRYCCRGMLLLPLGYRQLWIPLWARGLSLLFKVQKEETCSK